MQYGGQTPLKLARDLEANGVPIIGTTPDMIDCAEDRERFQKMLHKLGLKQPPNRTARARGQALALAQEIGYPLVVRPSYVLGGRAMEIVHEQERPGALHARGGEGVQRHARCCSTASSTTPSKWTWMRCATASDVLIGGIMEHIEQAGVHSGDSACSLPPYSLSAGTAGRTARARPSRMAKGLNVVGLMNVQFAIQDDVVFVLEVNPRASRTVPFVSKATGHAAGQDRRALHGRPYARPSRALARK